MSFSAGFSASGFSVTADNAIDYLAGTDAAGAGYVGANIQALGQQEHGDMLSLQRTLHQDGQQLMGVVSEKSDEIMAVNQAGFSQVDATMRRGFSSLKTLSGVQIAVQAAGFAVVAGQLQGVRRDLRHLAVQGEQLIQLQRIANQRLDQLVDIAQRSLEVQEKILDALLTSRTVEAQQLLRQGWENLKHGYEDEALARFEQSLNYDNTVFMAHAQLARLCRKRGDKARAEDHYVRASKFSTSVNPDVHTLACLEYATFLEDEGRFVDCVAQLRYVLQHSDKPIWRFHLAELLARTGQGDAAVAELRRAIESDDELFAASMASHDFARGLGPALVRLLADLDEVRRRAGFEHLKAIGADIDRLDSIAAFETPATEHVRRVADDLRDRAAATTRALFGVAYAELPGPVRNAYELRGQATREVDVAVATTTTALYTWIAAWQQSVRAANAQRALPPPTMPRSVIGPFAILLLIAGSVMTLVGVVAWGGYGWGAGWLLVQGVAVPLAIGVATLPLGATLRIMHERGKRQLVDRHRKLLETHQVREMERASQTAVVVAMLLHAYGAARVILAKWSATVPAAAFASLDSRLASERPSPPDVVGDVPSELPFWKQLASKPFGAVPTFEPARDGTLPSFLPSYALGSQATPQPSHTGQRSMRSPRVERAPMAPRVRRALVAYSVLAIVGLCVLGGISRSAREQTDRDLHDACRAKFVPVQSTFESELKSADDALVAWIKNEGCCYASAMSASFATAVKPAETTMDELFPVPNDCYPALDVDVDFRDDRNRLGELEQLADGLLKFSTLAASSRSEDAYSASRIANAAKTTSTRLGGMPALATIGAQEHQLDERSNDLHRNEGDQANARDQADHEAKKQANFGACNQLAGAGYQLLQAAQQAGCIDQAGMLVTDPARADCQQYGDKMAEAKRLYKEGCE